MLEYIDRRNTSSVKWDGLEQTYGADGLLPLWVADMDFRVDSHITDAMHRYIDTGVPGYYVVPDSYYESFIDWERDMHGLEVQRDWMRYSPGVVSGFHIALQVLTEPGDAVIVTTPVYYPFMNSVRSTGRRLVCSQLINRGGRYYIDFEDFEEKIRANDVRAFILCSPHNPVSRVWSENELCRLLAICRANGVAVISDEIHHDLTFGGRPETRRADNDDSSDYNGQTGVAGRADLVDNAASAVSGDDSQPCGTVVTCASHIPTLSLAEEGDRIIMLTAASKTFNIAGLQNSIAVIPDSEVREGWDRFTASISLRSGNPLGYIAAEAAYRYGRPWLDEVLNTVRGNYEYIRNEFAAALPDVIMTPLEATYLAWADFGAYLTSDELQPFMQDKCGLAFDYGSWFEPADSTSETTQAKADASGHESSGSFIRINLATSRANIEEMIRRIIDNLQ